MRKKRTWHPNFIKYMEFIVHHTSYSDLPNKFRGNGEILWVSPSDKLRATWWDKKVRDLGCINRAEVARKIHPRELDGLKPCQICGKQLSIFYIYPNKNTLKKLNAIAPEFQFSPYTEDIDTIVNTILKAPGKDGLSAIKIAFDVPHDVKEEKDQILKYIKENRKTRLSPGVMGNPPDRLDGFHTYNACCRPLEDTGRLASNLARYTQDRRVYENWTDGDWNLSNRLMGEFNKFELEIECPKCKRLRRMTADHIGPISLGFMHRPRFNPLCRECNSRKNNRMTLDDIKTLLEDERSGEEVISWHSRYIWDLLKNKIHIQNEALRMSRLMRANLHHVLILFSKISVAGHNQFLHKFLHPEYSFFDYKFVGFHPLTGAKKIIRKPLDSVNKRKNASRYIKIAFDSLKKYEAIENRNTKKWQSLVIDRNLDRLLVALSQKNEIGGKIILRRILKHFALTAESIFDKGS